MQRLLVPALLCVLAACSRGPAYDYDATAKAVLINAVAPEAYYYSFSTYSYDQYAYPVTWGVPDLIESAVREASPVEFIDYAAPDLMIGFDMSGFEAGLESGKSSPIRATAGGVCQDTGADALVVLGTVAVDWSEGGTPRVSQGYGLMTRSTSGQRRFWAYSIPAAVTINCKPLAYSTTVVAYRNPVEMRGFRPSLAVDRLTNEQREQIRDAVLGSLQRGQGDELSAIDTLSRAIASQFDPRVEAPESVRPASRDDEKRGVW